MTDNAHENQPYIHNIESTDMNFRVYKSNPFKFVINGTPIYVHAELLSQVSKPLDRMMNGTMSEAQQGYAVLEEVEVDTFHRFVEWVYKGYYTPATFTIDPTATLPPAQNPAGAQSPYSQRSPAYTPNDLMLPDESALVSRVNPDWAGALTPYAHRVPSHFQRTGAQIPYEHGYSSNFQAGTRESMKRSFQTSELSTDPYTANMPRSRPNENHTEDYTDVFLSHAQLYVFADIYDIRDLKWHALDGLHDLLKVFTLYDARIGDVVALFRYIYTNTVRETDEIRLMLGQYLGGDIDVLMRNQGFRQLMIEDGGTLLADFTRVVGRRVC